MELTDNATTSEPPTRASSRRHCLLYVDGSCSGNNLLDISKRKMIAAVVDDDGKVLVETRQPGGSNNLAELTAVKEALQWAKDHGYDDVEIRTDSQNNLRWVFREIGWGMNDRQAVLDLRRTVDLLRADVHLNLVWVPREKNLAGLYLEQWSSVGPGAWATVLKRSKQAPE
jgi:ribonuclease HI